ncbi:MAG TPA: class I SAM-dependent methyltransferase [Bryobacteraceae bacterium]|nr:class I SAM-dependent methyltransferase [Bryobacteraceae bacterium]
MDSRRPYYHQFAWAYDLLQTDPVAPRVDFIQSVLSHHHIATNASILDAGCGTGRYAAELAKRGFSVSGVDQSEDLIAVARQRDPEAAPRPEFAVANLLEASFPIPFDAILCRGVLNDFVDDSARRTVFQNFSTWLRPGGLLVFDVREWTRTLDRYRRNPSHRRTVALPDGVLAFESETGLNVELRQLHIRERFDVEQAGVRTITENDFTMRCWTPNEIASCLSATGLDEIATPTTYGDQDRAWSDRLVLVARKRAPSPRPQAQ